MRNLKVILLLLLFINLLFAQGINKGNRLYEYTEKKIKITSRLEKLYNSILKTKEKLIQFGYDIFDREVPSLDVSVGDRYVLGPGDELVFYFWGDPVDVLGLESYYVFEVDREGKVFVPSVGVVYVWNRALSDVKKELRERLSKKFKRFEIDVSVGKLRTFPVYVSGYVKKPGIVLAKATYTLLDVLTLAGGISKNGSLRNIKLRRASGKEISVDLYDFLVEGEPVDLFVKEGDTVYVDKIGRTVGIAGAVKRPAIYELKEEHTFEEALNLAGGPLFSAYDYGVRIFRYENNRLVVRTRKLSDESFAKGRIKDGDLIRIEGVNPFVWNRVTVRGHVQYPGEYSVEKYKTLRALVEVIGLLPDTNIYYAEIVRREKPGKEPVIVNFSPEEIIRGGKDIQLKPLDEVVFYPNWVYPPIKVSGEVKNPKVIPYYKGITLLDVLRSIDYKLNIKNLKAVIVFRKSMKESKQTVVYLYDLLAKGQGNLVIEPGTEVLILRKKPSEKTISVTILGEIKRPGVYKLKEGIRLSDIIEEAGGYTDKAYPQGLIFIRQSAKKLQEEHLKIAINTLEQSLSRSENELGLASASGEEKVALQITLRKQRELLNLIKQKAKIGLGRIALDIPPTLEELRRKPDQDILLEDGDYIYVPSRPNYVLVLGDVYNQISIPYVKGKPLSYYLEQVGGPGKHADLENIYVIKANGRVVARRNYVKFFRFSWKEGKLYFAGDFMDMPLDEGDTIVVPSELEVPTMWRPLIRDVVQIIFQAISTAVLAKRL